MDGCELGGPGGDCTLRKGRHLKSTALRRKSSQDFEYGANRNTV